MYALTVLVLQSCVYCIATYFLPLSRLRTPSVYATPSLLLARTMNRAMSQLANALSMVRIFHRLRIVPIHTHHNCCFRNTLTRLMAINNLNLSKPLNPFLMPITVAFILYISDSVVTRQQLSFLPHFAGHVFAASIAEMSYALVLLNWLHLQKSKILTKTIFLLTMQELLVSTF